MWNVHNQVNVLRCTVTVPSRINTPIKDEPKCSQNTRTTRVININIIWVQIVFTLFFPMTGNFVMYSACCELIKVCPWVNFEMLYWKVSGACFCHCITWAAWLTKREVSVDPEQSLWKNRQNILWTISGLSWAEEVLKVGRTWLWKTVKQVLVKKLPRRKKFLYI